MPHCVRLKDVWLFEQAGDHWLEVLEPHSVGKRYLPLAVSDGFGQTGGIFLKNFDLWSKMV